MWNTIHLYFHLSDYKPEDIKDVMDFLAAGMPDTERSVSIDELKQIFHPLLKKILKDKTLPSFLMFLFHECDVKPCNGGDNPCQANGHVLHATTNLIIKQENILCTVSPTDSNVESTAEHQTPERQFVLKHSDEKMPLDVMADKGVVVFPIKDQQTADQARSGDFGSENNGIVSSNSPEEGFYSILEKYHADIGVFWELLSHKSKQRHGSIEVAKDLDFYDLAKEAYTENSNRFIALKLADIDNRDFYTSNIKPKRKIIGSILQKIVWNEWPKAFIGPEIKDNIQWLFDQFKKHGPYKSP